MYIKDLMIDVTYPLMQSRTVSSVFINEICTFSGANTSALCDNRVLIMILKLKPNSSTFII